MSDPIIVQLHSLAVPLALLVEFDSSIGIRFVDKLDRKRWWKGLHRPRCLASHCYFSHLAFVVRRMSMGTITSAVVRVKIQGGRCTLTSNAQFSSRALRRAVAASVRDSATPSLTEDSSTQWLRDAHAFLTQTNCQPSPMILVPLSTSARWMLAMTLFLKFLACLVPVAINTGGTQPRV